MFFVLGFFWDRNVFELCNDVKMENDVWLWFGNIGRYVWNEKYMNFKVKCYGKRNLIKKFYFFFVIFKK